MPFDSPDRPLGELLTNIAKGKLQLPDFQREWKWDDDRIVGLLASISLGYPVGVVMTLEVGGEGVAFAPRPLSGVDDKELAAPEELILDGQQRLTSLFQALMSGRAVDTMDARGKKFARWYYIDIAKAVDPTVDREESILRLPGDRIERTDFGRQVKADYSTTERECAAGVFPLAKAYDQGSIFAWHNQYTQGGNASQRVALWVDFYNKVLNNVISYTVPVIVLKKSTPKEAVCTVFEKVNTGGIALNVFELMTATFASDGFRLNDDWKARRTQLIKHRVLRSVESTDFLQSISLLATMTKRVNHLKNGGEPSQAPGVSCKRKEILGLTLEEYKRWAEPVTKALDWSASFFAEERIFDAKDLPYRTQLVPLAAIHAYLGTGAETGRAIDQLRRWYWSGVLGELYGGATETRFARDMEQVITWLQGGPEPSTVVDASFQESRLLTLRTRNSAAYKGIYALLMRSGCVDWVKHQPLQIATFFDYRIDIHHVFPKKWCSENQIPAAERESIVNKTALSFRTNRSIGGRSPADYMPLLEREAGRSPAEMDAIVATHAINPAHLRTADFEAYFAQRSDTLMELVADAIGKPVIRDVDVARADAKDFEEEDEEVEAEDDEELAEAVG